MFIISKDITIELETEDEQRFYFDAVTGHSTSMEWDGPSKPIASGYRKSQAIRPAGEEITLTGCVGVQASTKGGVDLFDGISNRTAEACRLIQQMGDAADCVEIEIGDKIYENVFLRSARGNHPRDDYSEFTLTFKRIDVFNPSEVFNAALGAEVDLGEVTAPTGTPATPPPLLPTPLPSEGFFDGDGFDDFFSELLQGNTGAFSECEECGNAANTKCIDECYGRALNSGGF